MNKQANIGDWQVDWDAGWIRSRKTYWKKRRYPDPRIMAVLGLLADRAGELVSAEDILDKVWHDRVVGRDSVSTAIYQLRKLLGDETQRPTYIRTEARRGYRLIADISNVDATRNKIRVAVAGIAAIGLVMIGSGWMISESANHESAMILVEQMQDETDESLGLMQVAIESTLFGELVNQLPGRVILESSPVVPSYTLQSKIVACDLGPALLVRLMDTEDSSFLWYESYRLEDWTGGADEPTLVQEVAREVGAFVNTL